ncbi:MAG: hypothetical protein KC940_16330, partial [Candidatus Omnitrophica bacterium]|nr:hypothetical protein [Candidatus Omnitrophota bacterium]
STYTIDRCLFDRNTNIPPLNKEEKQTGVGLSTKGGAIYSQSSKGSIVNSLFVDNQARRGSIVSLKETDFEDVVFQNCTMDIDTDYFGTRGVAWEFGESPKFLNCIFVSEGFPYFFTLDTADVTYSLIEKGYPGEGNIDANPRFSNRENGDYHLQRGSPCIDSGTDTGLTEDFDGNDRPVGDYDMGAFEFPFLRSDIDGSGKVDSHDLLILQEDWMLMSGP